MRIVKKEVMEKVEDNAGKPKTVINGIDCILLNPDSKPRKKLYAKVPLSILEEIPAKYFSKMLVLLYAYGRMGREEWFTLSSKVLEKYGITRREKSKALQVFEEAGVVELDKKPGRAVRIKLLQKNAAR